MTLKSDDLPSQKWQEFGVFDPSTRKSQKLCTLSGSYCAKYLMFDLKSTEELSFMTLKSDAKFDEQLTCVLKNDTRYLATFHQSTRKCQNWDFDGGLLSKVENI